MPPDEKHQSAKEAKSGNSPYHMCTLLIGIWIKCISQPSNLAILHIPLQLNVLVGETSERHKASLQHEHRSETTECISVALGLLCH